MTDTFSGRILYTNNIVASGVEVRVFDKDQPSSPNDDLTVTPGQSDASGHFTVTYDDSKLQNPGAVNLSPTLNRLFGWNTQPSPIQLPDIFGTIQPYLQFHYSFEGQDKTSLAPLQTLQQDYSIPDTIPLQFIPSQDGFQFINNFSGYPLPISIPALPGHPNVPPAYGLCGGMSSSAYDFYLAGRQIPQATTVPSQGSRLQRYLFKRSIDSFGSFGESVVKVARWTALPDAGITGTQKLTYDEFSQIRSRLDQQCCVLIGLVYESASNLSEVLSKIWDNHQVLAYKYTVGSNNDLFVYIYDPNYPNDPSNPIADNISIHLEPVDADGNGTPGYRCTQLISTQGTLNIRGFFAMTYSPVEPPDGL